MRVLRFELRNGDHVEMADPHPEWEAQQVARTIGMLVGRGLPILGTSLDGDPMAVAGSAVSSVRVVEAG